MDYNDAFKEDLERMYQEEGLEEGDNVNDLDDRIENLQKKIELVDKKNEVLDQFNAYLEKLIEENEHE